MLDWFRKLIGSRDKERDHQHRAPPKPVPSPAQAHGAPLKPLTNFTVVRFPKPTAENTTALGIAASSAINHQDEVDAGDTEPHSYGGSD